MKKFFTFFLLTLGLHLICHAQNYSFTEHNGVFVPVTNGIAIDAIEADDALSGVINVGFSFNYNGTLYSQLKVSSNGFITFNTNLTSSSTYLSSANAVIAPLGADLEGRYGGSASYLLSGIAPNRILTVEWLNWRSYYGVSEIDISFQVLLYENTNRIEFVYRPEAGSYVSESYRIGLGFQTPNFIAINNSSSPATISNLVERFNLPTRPASGKTFRFDEAIKPEPSNDALNLQSFNVGNVAIKWIDNQGLSKADRYLIKSSNVSFADVLNPVDGIEYTPDLNLKDGTGLVYVNADVQKFNGWTDSIGNTAVYFKIFALSNYGTYVNYKTSGVVAQLKVDAPFYQTKSVKTTNINATSLDLSWIRGSGANCVVFAKENGTDVAQPLNNTSYIANPILGQGTSIGSTGWYCIYNGNGTSVSLTGLKSNTLYKFQAFEYDGLVGSQQYFNGVGLGNPFATYSSLFSEQSNVGLPNLEGAANAWGDYDNDGDLDVLLTGYSMYDRISKIYKNNGNNSFTEQTSIVLPGVSYGAAAWGDYDNDGDLDVLLTGSSVSGRISKIYKNNGDNSFAEQTSIVLPGVSYGAVAWGDYDNDGDLDILLTGSKTGSILMSNVFKNNGDNTFLEQTSISLSPVNQSSVVWSDYDNDGDLDIFIAGINNAYNAIVEAYTNGGNGSFSKLLTNSIIVYSQPTLSLADFDNDGDFDILVSDYYETRIYKNNKDGVFNLANSVSLIDSYTNTTSSCGDYDNDGDIDVVASSGSSLRSSFYKNNGNGTFSLENFYVAGFEYVGLMSFIDYDNDGRLDFFLSGDNYSNSVTKLYKNEVTAINTAPAVPTSISSSVLLNTYTTISWTAPADNSTPSAALTYNLRVGTTPGGSQIVAPMASSSGFRKVAAIGNLQNGTSCLLLNLSPGTYYYSLQAIDHNFAGGPFSAEKFFIVDAPAQPVQASGITFSQIASTSTKVSWVRGNGDKCAVFAKEASTGSSTPVNNTTYTANATMGAGTQVGTSGWFCIYDGTEATVTATGLKSSTTYQYHVVEYKGLAGAEQYYTGTATNNPLSSQTSAVVLNSFVEQTTITLPAVSHSSSAWGDYDNDGDLDVLLAGFTGSTNITKIFRNNGDNTFTELTGSTFIGVKDGCVAWGDYNNDGFLDILIAGSGGSKIYKNNGNSTFTVQTSINNIPTANHTSVAWGDYNNDGFLDILFTGNNGDFVSKIFKNNGNNSFTEQTSIALYGVDGGSVAWGDYDNDGDLDVLLSGYNPSGRKSKIYKNNGDGTFTDQTDIIFVGLSWSTAAWGDYDNDGDLDVLLMGSGITKIYKNNGNNAFAELTGITLAQVNFTAAAWGDYDNDGDLDVLITGDTSSATISKVYRNNGDNTFTDQTDIALTGVNEGSVAWGDYDNDGDLDLLLSGLTSIGGRITKIYKNGVTVANTAPAKVLGLTTQMLDATTCKLSWTKGSDAQTPADGLCYNVFYKEKGTSGQLNAPMSNLTTGYRMVSAFGASKNTYAVIKALVPGTYEFYVQAIDGGFKAGAWSDALELVATGGAPTSTAPAAETGVLTMYPNPASGQLFVQTSEQNLGVAIFNMQGQLLLQYNNVDSNSAIDISSLKAGLYEVKFIGSDKTWVERLLVK